MSWRGREEKVLSIIHKEHHPSVNPRVWRRLRETNNKGKGKYGPGNENCSAVSDLTQAEDRYARQVFPPGCTYMCGIQPLFSLSPFYSECQYVVSWLKLG